MAFDSSVLIAILGLVCAASLGLRGAVSVERRRVVARTGRLLEVLEAAASSREVAPEDVEPTRDRRMTTVRR